MSIAKNAIAIAFIATFASSTAALAGAAGGGTELPDSAAGKGSQNPKAGGAGDPKGDTTKKGDTTGKDGSMKKNDDKM